MKLLLTRYVTTVLIIITDFFGRVRFTEKSFPFLPELFFLNFFLSMTSRNHDSMYVCSRYTFPHFLTLAQCALALEKRVTVTVTL
jgi:hypothetical protein